MSFSLAPAVARMPSLASLPALSQDAPDSGPSPPESGISTPIEITDTGITSLDEFSMEYPERSGEDSRCSSSTQVGTDASASNDKEVDRGRTLTRAVTRARKIASSLSLRRILRKRGASPEPGASKGSSIEEEPMPGSWSLNRSLDSSASRLSIAVTQNITFDVTPLPDGSMGVTNPAVTMVQAMLPGFDAHIETTSTDAASSTASIDSEVSSESLTPPTSIEESELERRIRLRQMQTTEEFLAEIKLRWDCIKAELAIAEADGWEILCMTLRVAMFLPWTIAVGGTIALAPEYLDLVTFGPGYITPPRGLRRFAHWAECAWHHVAIFAASILALVLWKREVGVAVAAVVGARAMWVWGKFCADSQAPLGEDDMQSVYSVLSSGYLDEDPVIVHHGDTSGSDITTPKMAQIDSETNEFVAELEFVK